MQPCVGTVQDHGSELASGVAPGKPNWKKGQFMNFSQGHSGTKVRYVNRACFPKEKHQNSLKNGAKFMSFLFWPFLWFRLPGRLLSTERERERERERETRKKRAGARNSVLCIKNLALRLELFDHGCSEKKGV